MNATTGTKRTTRGGARTGAGRKPYPQFGPDGIVIEVSNGRCCVSRWVRNGPAFQLQHAWNWEELLDDAEQEVIAVGGESGLFGIYPCTPELAERADWSIKKIVHWMGAGWYVPRVEDRGYGWEMWYSWRSSDRNWKPVSNSPKRFGSPEWFDQPPADVEAR